MNEALTEDTWQSGQDLIDFIQCKYDLLLEYDALKFVLTRAEIEEKIGGSANMPDFHKALDLQIKDLKWLEKEKDLVVELYFTNRGAPHHLAEKGEAQGFIVIFLPTDGLERMDFVWKGSEYIPGTLITRLQKLIDNDGFEEGGRWGIPEVPPEIASSDPKAVLR